MDIYVRVTVFKLIFVIWVLCWDENSITYDRLFIQSSPFLANVANYGNVEETYIKAKCVLLYTCFCARIISSTYFVWTRKGQVYCLCVQIALSRALTMLWEGLPREKIQLVMERKSKNKLWIYKQIISFCIYRLITKSVFYPYGSSLHRNLLSSTDLLGGWPITISNLVKNYWLSIWHSLFELLIVPLISRLSS